jgi:hypothetical protein
MTEKKTHDADREALREVIDHPEHTGKHEEHLLRYLSGVVYHEEGEESRERREEAAEEAAR